MATAMMHGGPNPAEILFKVRIRPADTPPEDAPLATNQKNPDPKVKIEGPYKAYGVDLVPDAKNRAGALTTTRETTPARSRRKVRYSGSYRVFV